jgi:hypothetical protein
MKLARVFPCLVLVTGYLAAAGPDDRLRPLKTRPELTNYTETSRYEDVIRFIQVLDDASPLIHVAGMGYSWEGRKLPLVVAGRVKDASPEAVKASGKTRVYIQGNIHAGEVEGKEATQELLREIALGGHGQWLETMVLLVCPIYNADGNERVTLGNRPAQHGPVGGMGQRATAQNFDLNRDLMKLDSPEARSFVRMLNLYDPQVVLDLHTTNGTRHAYHLTYEAPLHPDTSPSIVGFLRDELLPSVTRSIKDKDGWDIYYYGNIPGAWPGWTGERGWYTSDHTARFNNNYVGLRNRIAILSECFAYLTFEERIRATKRFVEEVLDYVGPRGREITKAIAEAEADTAVGRDLAVRAKLVRSAAPVEILMGECKEEKNPYTGAVMLRRLDVRRPEKMYEYGSYEAAETSRAPRAYLVPASLKRAVDRLEAHGIRTYPLEKDTPLNVESFQIESMSLAQREYQGHKERTIVGSWVAEQRSVPAGTLIVSVDQSIGRVVFLLLEPRSDDSLALWNLMDDVLEKAKTYPVLRTSDPLPAHH